MNEETLRNPGKEARGKRDSAEREGAIAAALAEFLDRTSREEFVDVDAFCRDYKELEEELRPLLQVLKEMDATDYPKGNSTTEEPEPLPERLSGYKILGEIGAGGMGRVLLAQDEGLNRKIAIKVLSMRLGQDALIRTRFMQEARALAQINHPDIVTIHSLGGAEEIPHFVMEYVDGADLFTATRALTIEQRAGLMRKVALAVEVLHHHHILHRDLKPANILVGADLQPKLLDFGLARREESTDHLTLFGEMLGTPSYFSPEQTTGDQELDARSDIFSLGTILYEVLTGVLPFPVQPFERQMKGIRHEEPELPRRINSDIPGDLQDICLKALEKKPENRYRSAQEMADDLERFLAGEKVHANPTTYGSLVSARIQEHLGEIEGWRHDEVLTDAEYEGFRKQYGRLVEREDAWILQARRLTFPQVSLYLGAWILIAGAALLFLFHFVRLSGTPRVLIAACVTALTWREGLALWRRNQLRNGIAHLLAVCLLVPITLLVAMGEYHIRAIPAANPDWELLHNISGSFKEITNLQLWWAIALSMPVYIWLRRYTRSSVFSLVACVMGVMLCLVTLARMGLIDWLNHDHSKLYFRLIPIAIVFLICGYVMERLNLSNDSRYFYPVGVAFAFLAMSGLASDYQQFQNSLKRALPWTRGDIEYLFVVNAGIYFVFQLVFGNFALSQLRAVAKAFRFVIPGHILTSLLSLGVRASGRWNESVEDLSLKHEARTFEILLPLVACVFIYASIPKQMKNYFVTGALFLGIGIVRLQQDIFQDQARWSIALLLLGLLLMLAATRYSSIKMTFARLLKRSF
ncbi:MAG TPA: serine/threonine-protein kinase [Candidatus Acidoferrum sp.]|nr:serine/threonine-protein kinase [Candidatus Acidoferrum sp.]